MSLSKKMKPPVNFHALDMEQGWEPAPGALVTDEFVHPYWEEVYFLDGELTAGCDAQGEGGVTFTGPCYTCRPPGTYHGPFTSKTGCIFFEIQYYA